MSVCLGGTLAASHHDRGFRGLRRTLAAVGEEQYAGAVDQPRHGDEGPRMLLKLAERPPLRVGRRTGGPVGIQPPKQPRNAAEPQGWTKSTMRRSCRRLLGNVENDIADGAAAFDEFVSFGDARQWQACGDVVLEPVAFEQSGQSFNRRDTVCR